MQDFLSAVLASEGHYCIVGISKGRVTQKFVDSIAETQELVDKFLSEDKDVYFALATFIDPNAAKPREQKNVCKIRSLWVDIDCGDGKDYADKMEGLSSLVEFVKVNGMLEPIVVDSGNGIHAYWPLSTELTRDEWQPIANAFKQFCFDKGLRIDAACTADSARILRIPNTKNFKSDPPKDVSLLDTDSQIYDLNTLKELLPKAEEPVEKVPKKELSAMTKALMGNKTTYFKNIVVKSVAGNGCQQILRALEDPANIDERTWRACLSVAVHCEDWEKAIHKLSKGHPNYDPDETETKAIRTKHQNSGPFKCTTFEQYYPEACEDCPNKGKFTSPIALGQEIVESTDTVIVEEVVPEGGEGEEGEEVKVEYEIPAIPEPYFRGRNGGIYRRAKDDDSIMIYPFDLFVIERISDPNFGESVWFRLHLPQDGVVNFTISAPALTGPDTMRVEMSKHGVLLYGKQWLELQGYIFRAAQELQVKRRAQVAHYQFGWTTKRTFVAGCEELGKDGVKRFVPPTATTMDMVDWFHTKGTLDNWKEAFNGYAVSGYEPHAFAALTGFGAPLLKVTTNHKGVLLNLIHGESGTGKTTVLRMINSVWGHPEDPLRNAADTKNSTVLRMGVLNNIPLTVDEMTNLKSEEISNFLYGITQGRGRDRMNGNSNTLRVNKTTWRTIGVTTSNSSFYDKLYALKDLPKGEIFRCVEYHISPNKIIGVAEGVRLFDELLMENYGHAWYPYIHAVMHNLDSIAENVKRVTEYFTQKLNLLPSYRFYSALGAVNIVGGEVAREIGLHEYPIERIKEFYLDTISSIRHNNITEDHGATTFVSHYLLKHMSQHALIIDSTADARSSFASKQTPRGELLIRMEPDTQRVFITVKHLRKECTESQMSYNELLSDLRKDKILIDVIKKGMSKGTQLSTKPVDALVLDAAKMDIEIAEPPENVVRPD